VATNISLIADLRVVELGVEPSPKWPKKWLLVFTATAILAITFVLVATNISKQRYVKVVHHEADDVLRENGVLLEDMSHALASGKRQDFERIRTIKSYLTNQRAGLPELTIIYSGKFDGKLTFYQTNDYIPPDNVDYLPSYFACTVGQDCEYLRRFFSGGNAEVLEKYHLRDDQFYFYVPFVGKESRYVLLFERRNSYGKVGS
jgi:hypothetical protein